VTSQNVLLDIVNKHGKGYNRLPFQLWIFITHSPIVQVVNAFNQEVEWCPNICHWIGYAGLDFVAMHKAAEMPPRSIQ